MPTPRRELRGLSPSPLTLCSLARIDEWIEIWNVLRERANTAEERRVKADKVERLGRRMHETWGQWAGRQAVKYYLHELAHHI